MPVLTIVQKSQNDAEKVVSPIIEEIPAENTDENKTSETN